jgi:hypothetical protein
MFTVETGVSDGRASLREEARTTCDPIVLR